MIKKVLLGVVAVSALATAVAIALVAAAFAIYAVLVPELGQPGAAAVVAGVAAVIVALAGLFVALRAQGGLHRRQPEPEPTLVDRIFQVARERPILAAGGALAAGLLALKNPQAAAGLVSAFLAGKAADKADNRRR